jgi:hypothetical protein
MAGALSKLPTGGCNPEFTYIGGLGPSLITSHGQTLHLGSLRAMAHGDLARGMTHDGHILLENHEIARTGRATPDTSSCQVQTSCMEKLDPTIESCSGQRLCHRNATSQSTHER